MNMSEKSKHLKKEYRKSRVLTVLMILVVFFYILSSSIAVPILCKPFYYAQIGDLGLEESSGFTHEQIVTAYSEVVDYCIGAREDFAVGELGYSEDGKDHFTDCRGLFLLDLGVLAGTVLILVVWLLLRCIVPVRCTRPKGHSVGFWGALIVLISFVMIGGLGSIDFDKTFVIFHSLFFPGKANWIFNPEVDEIINILPEQFFMRCAIVIVALIVVQSLIFILADLIAGAKRKHNK